MRDALARSLDEKSALIDQALEEFLRSDLRQTPNLHDGMLYGLGLDQEDRAARGKRIRPALCLVACEALDGDMELALPFAMAIELMHNFFLVHDDIQDGDEFRRGRPAVWKRYGLNHAINIGDFLFTKVFAAFQSRRAGEIDPTVQLRLLRLLVETLEYTHIGQALDMNALGKDDVALDQYLEIVTNKTGYYLAAPMLGGAMVAGAPEETLDAIRGLGRNVGPVFQIVDDTIDLTQGKGRETVGSDIREGKRSYLVAHAASKTGEDERRELFRVLNLPREETTAEHIEWVSDLFARHGTVEAGQAYCRSLMEQARAAIAPAPERLRETLLGIFEGLLHRKN